MKAPNETFGYLSIVGLKLHQFTYQSYTDNYNTCLRRRKKTIKDRKLKFKKRKRRPGTSEFSASGKNSLLYNKHETKQNKTRGL